ncbi:MAG: phosphoglucomutase/phosphomannomutase family protein [Thermincola sp.]|jgi:alpha-D-glucose phosphate-specific phosphoglucomutase|nr:phosphoglucomutase/phosphomannomutase family protein [Thermincola sp.]MDT3703406.1 phosphoglucomutase/phosphomannomutase family protein [Thermincola sp.]
MPKIKFGTDGWREIVAREFTFENVKFVTQAVGEYICNHDMCDRGVVIGYDNRFLSEQFAQAVAEVLCGNGITVYMTSRATPTPVTAFAVKHLSAGGALMLTASHNPPEYNGIKFIPEYAGPALPYITDEIEINVQKVLERGQYKELRFDKAREMGLVKDIEPYEAYIAHLKTLVNLAGIGKAKLKVVVDPMYGAGIGYLETILRDAGCEVKVIHGYRDTLFGGSLPEPSAKVLVELKEQVISGGADLGLALDGDADRFGIIDSDGTYIVPNQVLFLIYYHLINSRGIKGPVARTVATTHMLDRIAAYYGQEVDETPVGFKYMGESMMKRGSILGGEESGGLSIVGHIPEKDGILAAALIAELVAEEKKPIQEILKSLEAKFGALLNERLDIHTTPEDKERVLGLIKELAPTSIAGIAVTKTLSLDGKKFVLADGSWVLIRPSGTEPLFRVYVETDQKEKIMTIQQATREMLGL